MHKVNMTDKMKSLLRKKSSCVLATTDGDRPHCSLMAYITLETADRVFLVTPRNTRKYRNIKQNPNVSLLIDTRGEQARINTQAITLTGTCYELGDDEEIAVVKEAFNRTHSHLHGLIGKGDVVFLCVAFDSFLFLTGPENAYHEVMGEKQLE